MSPNDRPNTSLSPAKPLQASTHKEYDESNWVEAESDLHPQFPP
jgi:hypothetical protein